MDIKKLVDLVKLIECLFKFGSLYFFWKKIPPKCCKTIKYLLEKLILTPWLLKCVFVDILGKIAKVHIISNVKVSKNNSIIDSAMNIFDLNYKLTFPLFLICRNEWYVSNYVITQPPLSHNWKFLERVLNILFFLEEYDFKTIVTLTSPWNRAKLSKNINSTYSICLVSMR